jgi:hypothetical protein
MAGLGCTVELTESGFLYVAGPSIHQVSWSEIGSVFQSESLLIFCHEDDEDALFIPKRAFGSEEELQEFVKLAYQKTVLEKNADGSNSSITKSA